MSCFPGCPDCTAVEGGCGCYPANGSCPSEAACRKTNGHVTLASGMVRSDDAGKPDYTLIDYSLVERWAVHMTAQAGVKGRNNWRQAHTEEDLERFKASGWRHWMALLRDETDEDHAVALIFNIGGIEHTRRKLRSS